MIKKAPKKDLSFTVDQPSELLSFLFLAMPSKSKPHVKGLLRDKCILVNGKTLTQFNSPLKNGDVVSVLGERPVELPRLRGLKIVYEDKFVIVVDKAPGLLSMATAKQKMLTAYAILSAYVKTQDPDNLIFIVHRLDKDTSGLMMFAKSEHVQQKLQENWIDTVYQRTYLAVVEQPMLEEKGTIDNYLIETSALQVFVTKNPDRGQRAVTHFEVMQQNQDYALVKVNLETGKKHQIRVHLNHIGHPIVGDKKYGTPSDPLNRLGLHAWVLAFVHPMTGKEHFFETNIPGGFLAVTKN